MDAKRADRVSLVVVVVHRGFLSSLDTDDPVTRWIDVSTRSAVDAGFRGGGLDTPVAIRPVYIEIEGGGGCVEEVKEELRDIERDPSIDALKIRDTFSRPNDAARPTDQPTRPLCNTSNVEDSFLLRGK